MPRTYTLTIEGKRYRVRAPRELSDADLQQIARQLRGGASPAQQPQGGLYEVIDLNTGRVLYSGPRPPQQQQQRPQQPAQNRRIIEPRESEAARNLAALIANPSIASQYRSALDAARVYAPAGMSEAEIRWAALEADRRAPSAIRQLWNAAVRPETVAPSYDVQRQGERPTGFIEGTANLLSAPLRSLTTTVLTRFGQGRAFGRETGTPTQVTDWASVYAADPNWGSVLEAFAPNVDPRLRQAAGVGLNAILDPLNLLGMGIVGQTGRGATRASTVARAAPRVQAAGRRLQQAGQAVQQSARAAQPAGRAARAARAARAVQQTAGKAVAATGKAIEKAAEPIPALSVMDRPRAEVLSGAFGIDPEKAEFVNSPLRIAGLPLHALLDLPAVRAAVQAAREAPRGEKLNEIFRNLAQVQWIRREVADRGGDIKAIQSVLRDLRKSGETVTPAGAEEVRRLKDLNRAQNRPSVFQRGLRLWKASKTTLNPPSMVRNFYQNFLFRYLTGDVDLQRLPPAVLRLIRNPERLRRLWQETEGVETAVSDIPRGLRGLAARLAQASNRAYEGADRLAASIMGEAMGVSPRAFMMNYGETPRLFSALARSGIAPFISWQYFAIPGVVRGAINHPDRLGKVARAITGLQQDPQSEYIQIGDREARLGSILPVNPADFGGEMPLIDIRQMPVMQLGKGLEQTLGGQGRPWPMRDASTGNRYLDTALFLKDFFGPPALTYYLPGLIAPAAPADTSQPHRRPRERVDYLLGLLGFAVRPHDPYYDAYRKHRDAAREWQKQQRELQK